MPTPQQKLANELLRSLPARPSQAQFDAALDALVQSAFAAKKPLMSIGATLRHCAELLDPGLRERLRDAASKRVLAPAGPIVAPHHPGATAAEWLTVREAAARAGCSVAVLYDRLRSVEHRRRLGWPMWDGFRWSIAAAVFDPARRAAFLLGQPEEEPLADLLPETCERAPRGVKIPLSIDDERADGAGASTEA
jgi:hypothetical protein